MTSPAKAKGDQAEREIAAILADLIGVTVRRKLGAGRTDDEGDLDGLEGVTVQVAWWPKKGPLRAVREKPLECERQRANAGTPLAVTFVRLHGGTWRAVLTPEQWATWYREATA